MKIEKIRGMDAATIGNGTEVIRFWLNDLGYIECSIEDGLLQVRSMSKNMNNHLIIYSAFSNQVHIGLGRKP